MPRLVLQKGQGQIPASAPSSGSHFGFLLLDGDSFLDVEKRRTTCPWVSWPFHCLSRVLEVRGLGVREAMGGPWLGLH